MNSKRYGPTVLICQTILLIVLACSCGPAGTALAPTITVAPDPTLPPTAAPAPTVATPPANSTGLSGPYLGQQAPGASPVRFAAAFIKGELHTPPVFMPDGSELYWSQELKIYRMRLKDGYWTRPESVAFSASITDYRDPSISLSGDKLFFLTRGTLPNSQLPEKQNLWFVERVGDGWGEPQPLGEEVNVMKLHWLVSVAANGNLYYGTIYDGVEDIYRSRYVDGQYIQAERLTAPINTDQMDVTPFIAPDESYLLFARLKDGTSTPRLYISYVDQNGEWGEPIMIDAVPYGLCPVVSPDGKYLFFLSSSSSVSWMSADFIEEMRPVTPSAVTPAPGASQAINAETIAEVELLQTLSGHSERVSALALSRDGKHLASYGEGKTIKLWDAGSGQELATFASQNQALNSLAFSPDGRLLASAETVWDVESRQVVYTLDRRQPGKPAFSPDGSLLAVGGGGMPVKLWNMASGQMVLTFDMQGKVDTFTTAFSPDGTMVATSGQDGVIRLWDVQSGQEVRTLAYDTEIGVHDIAFSPDGRLLASVGTDPRVQIWDLQAGQLLRTIYHSNGAYGVAFSPDGALVAAALCDRTVKIWDVASGERLRTLSHPDEVMDVVFSPDGTMLASGGYDNQIYLWGVP